MEKLGWKTHQNADRARGRHLYRVRISRNNRQIFRNFDDFENFGNFGAAVVVVDDPNRAPAPCSFLLLTRSSRQFCEKKKIYFFFSHAHVFFFCFWFTKIRLAFSFQQLLGSELESAPHNEEHYIMFFFASRRLSSHFCIWLRIYCIAVFFLVFRKIFSVIDDNWLIIFAPVVDTTHRMRNVYFISTDDDIGAYKSHVY